MSPRLTATILIPPGLFNQLERMVMGQEAIQGAFGQMFYTATHEFTEDLNIWVWSPAEILANSLMHEYIYWRRDTGFTDLFTLDSVDLGFVGPADVRSSRHSDMDDLLSFYEEFAQPTRPHYHDLVYRLMELEGSPRRLNVLPNRPR